MRLRGEGIRSREQGLGRISQRTTARSVLPTFSSTGPNGLENLFWLGKCAGFFLGIDQRIAERDLIDAPATGDERHARELAAVIVEEFFRQTGGLLEVASGGAVFDRQWSFVRHQSSPIQPTRPNCRECSLYSNTGAVSIFPSSVVRFRWLAYPYAS